MKIEAFGFGLGLSPHIRRLIDTERSLLNGYGVSSAVKEKLSSLVDETMCILRRKIKDKEDDLSSVFLLSPRAIMGNVRKISDMSDWVLSCGVPNYSNAEATEEEIIQYAQGLRDLSELEARAVLFVANAVALEKMQKAIS